jgi:hypothetical protein
VFLPTTTIHVPCVNHHDEELNLDLDLDLNHSYVVTSPALRRYSPSSAMTLACTTTLLILACLAAGTVTKAPHTWLSICLAFGATPMRYEFTQNEVFFIGLYAFGRHILDLLHVRQHHGWYS